MPAYVAYFERCFFFFVSRSFSVCEQYAVTMDRDCWTSRTESTDRRNIHSFYTQSNWVLFRCASHPSAQKMYISYILFNWTNADHTKIRIRRTNELNWFVVYWCLSKRKRSPFRRVVVAHQTDIYDIPYASAATPFAFNPITKRRPLRRRRHRHRRRTARIG